MLRLSFPEYRSLFVGALAGVIVVWLVWIGIEIVLRSLTAFAPLTPDECLRYLRHIAFPSAILGAATALSRRFARQNLVQTANRLRLAAGGFIGLFYVWQSVWYGAIRRVTSTFQDANGIIHTEVTTSLAPNPVGEVFQRIIMLLALKNYPFLWAFLMVAVSSVWLARQTMKQHSELSN